MNFKAQLYIFADKIFVKKKSKYLTITSWIKVIDKGKHFLISGSSMNYSKYFLITGSVNKYLHRNSGQLPAPFRLNISFSDFRLLLLDYLRNRIVCIVQRRTTKTTIEIINYIKVNGVIFKI